MDPLKSSKLTAVSLINPIFTIPVPITNVIGGNAEIDLLRRAIPPVTDA